MGCGTFDLATNADIDCGSPSALDDMWAGGATLSCWVNLASNGQNSFGRFFDKDNNTDAGWLLSCTNITGLAFGRGFSTNQGYWRTPTSSMSFGTDIHILVSYDEDSTANNPSIYINNSLQSLTEDSAPSGTASSDASQNLLMGNRPDNNAPCDGVIGHVKFWNRILSAAERATDYRGGMVGYGLFAWWPLMDGAPGVSASGASSIRDVVGGNHGTPSNSPVFQEDFSKIKMMV